MPCRYIFLFIAPSKRVRLSADSNCPDSRLALKGERSPAVVNGISPRNEVPVSPILFISSVIARNPIFVSNASAQGLSDLTIISSKHFSKLRPPLTASDHFHAPDSTRFSVE